MFRILRKAAIAAVPAAIALSFAFHPQPASAAPTGGACTTQPYAYAGLISNRTATGVKATVTPVSAPRVASGHVAGWIGVGGPGKGASGQDAWIQIGINSVPGSGNKIYTEAWIPGSGQAYTEVGEVPVGTKVNLIVRELPGQPGWWQASVDGRPVTKAVYLPGSHGTWQPMAITESWNGGVPSCNGFAYRFDDLRIATSSSSWRPMASAMTLTDPGYGISDRTTAGFVAGSLT